MKNDSILDRMAVFERPLHVEDTDVYGIIYNAEVAQRNKDLGGDISDYIAYLVGCEYFEKNGGVICDGGYLWQLPDGVHSISCNCALHRLLGVLMKNVVGFKTLEFKEPIHCNDDEVDNDKEGSCFILRQELIDRYTTKITEEK